MDVVTFATRVCKLLGVETMFGTLHDARSYCSELIVYLVTNAAGGLNQTYRVGDIVCLNDVRSIKAPNTAHTDVSSTSSWLDSWDFTLCEDPTLKSSVSASRRCLMRTTLT